MKKIFTVLMVLLALPFTQCKPDNGNEGGDKIRVRCDVPINSKGINGTRSDFADFTTDGSIMWSTGTERLYLAIPNNGDPQIIELVADEHTMKANILAFEGEVDEGILEQNGVYEVWYFGNSKTYGPQTYSETKSGDVIKSISGSIATQSGNLSDLGKYHIAKTTVTAKYENGEIVLPLRGTLKSEVAIAHLDLDGVTKLNGDAVIGTNYTYSYNAGSGQFEFAVTGGTSINVTDGSATSYVMLLPNATNDVVLESSKGTYTFKNAIEANKFYFRYLDNYVMAPLEWTGGGDPYNGYAYVDLGLPSGLKWATCNVGANSPTESGSFFAWAEVVTKSRYNFDNCPAYTNNIADFSGDPTYDAAAANWGGNWRMPTQAEMKELFDKCTWSKATDGYTITGPNGNSIYLPRAGYRDGSLLNSGYSYYWTSTPEGAKQFSYCLMENYFGNKNVGSFDRYYGMCVRAVAE